MKILNKKNKLKYSKMFIDKGAYQKICEKYGSSLEEHLGRLEKNSEAPDLTDLSIIYDLYHYITKIGNK